MGTCAGRADVSLSCFRLEARYDAIISIGAFEHFAHFGMARRDRVSAYRRFFRCCHERVDRQTARDMLFIIDRIFPQSVLPWPSEILEASERLFDVVVSTRHDPDHYSRTCQEWSDRLLANRNRAMELVGEPMVIDYQRYLSAAVDAFTKRHVGLMRIIFECA
ncbi:MAG: class I SAM-dependent methyltransferase [Pseudonocardiaceae bacterium]